MPEEADNCRDHGAVNVGRLLIDLHIKGSHSLLICHELRHLSDKFVANKNFVPRHVRRDLVVNGA